jgi:hypothetical protein
MELFKKIPFKFEENIYEICIYYEDNLINIGAFLNNYPANGFRYQIQIPKRVEMEKLLDEKKLGDFIEQAKNDIVQNRWKKFTHLFS